MAEAVVLTDETQLELLTDGAGVPSAEATEICSGSALSTPLHRRCCYRGRGSGDPQAPPGRRGRCATFSNNDWYTGAAVSILATLVLVACVYTIEYYGSEQASGGPPDQDPYDSNSSIWYNTDAYGNTSTTSASTVCISDASASLFVEEEGCGSMYFTSERLLMVPSGQYRADSASVLAEAEGVFGLAPGATQRYVAEGAGVTSAEATGAGAGDAGPGGGEGLHACAEEELDFSGDGARALRSYARQAAHELDVAGAVGGEAGGEAAEIRVVAYVTLDSSGKCHADGTVGDDDGEVRSNDKEEHGADFLPAGGANTDDQADTGPARRLRAAR